MHDAPHSSASGLADAAVTLPSGGLWPRLPVIGGVAGVVGLGLAFALGAGRKAELLPSYLVAFVFFATIALGGLFFVLLHHLTRAGWSVVLRRLAEHVAATLPLFAILFLPIAWGIHELYHWSHAEALAHDAILQKKAAYLNVPRFLAFAVVYFVVWTALSVYYRRQSTRQDGTSDRAITRKLQSLSAPAMIAFALTLNFAAVDWLMSLEPHWYSTIFGVYVFAGCVVAIVSTLILLAHGLQRSGSLQAVSTEHFQDLGKLLFAFVVFWAYIAFSQFMLIWYGNIPEETVWFHDRWQHGWKAASIALAAGHFGLPFLILLLRGIKRRPGLLAVAACWMLLVHLFDVYWLVMPTFRESPAPTLLDFACLLGVGGLFVAALGRLLAGSRLVPVGDPRLAESLAFENV